jgi:OFA family oxalate/formate antiporter-like MFS transporter
MQAAELRRECPMSLPSPAVTDQASERSLWLAIAATTCLNLPLGSLYAYSMLLQPLEQLLGVSRAALSFVFALSTIGFTVGMNVAPRCFGLGSPVLLVAISAGASAAGIGLAGAATGITALILGYGVLFGLGGGASYILFQQGVNLMLHRRSGLVNGYLVSLYPLGAMIAAPLFGLSIERWGVRATLFGLAATLAVAGLAACLLVAAAGMPLRPTAASGSIAAPAGTHRMGRLLAFWQLCTVFLLAAAAGLTVLSQAAGIVLAYGGTVTGALAATTLISAAVAAARLGGGWLCDTLAVPYVMALAHGTALAGAGLLVLWPSVDVAVLSLALIGAGAGLVSGATAAAVATYWPAALYGMVASRVYIAWGVAAVSLPVLAGHLYDLTGGYSTVVLIAGAGNFAGLLISLLLPRH